MDAQAPQLMSVGLPSLFGWRKVANLAAIAVLAPGTILAPGSIVTRLALVDQRTLAG